MSWKSKHESEFQTIDRHPKPKKTNNSQKTKEPMDSLSSPKYNPAITSTEVKIHKNVRKNDFITRNSDHLQAYYKKQSQLNEKIQEMERKQRETT